MHRHHADFGFRSCRRSCGRVRLKTCRRESATHAADGFGPAHECPIGLPLQGYNDATADQPSNTLPPGSTLTATRRTIAEGAGAGNARRGEGCRAVRAYSPQAWFSQYDIARLAPRRSRLVRQACGGNGASVPTAMRSRLRRNAQAGSRAWQKSHQAADRPAAMRLSREKQYPGLVPRPETSRSGQ